MDYEFVIDSKKVVDTLEHGVTWIGMSKTDIVFDGSLKRWNVSSKLDQKLITTMDLMGSG